MAGLLAGLVVVVAWVAPAGSAPATTQSAGSRGATQTTGTSATDQSTGMRVTSRERGTFYISPLGDDAAAGTSPETPWQTLNRANHVDFEPGSKILLQGGQTHYGTLALTAEDRGTRSKPISIGSYGTGRAIIRPPRWAGIWIKNTAGVRVSRLTIVGPGAHAESRSGINAINDLPGDVKLPFLTIDRVDVSGFSEQGIDIAGTNGNSGFRHVRITNVAAHENLLTGILVEGEFKAVGGGFDPEGAIPEGYAHEDVRIRHARAYRNFGTKGEHHSGDGIVLSATQKGSIEQSVAYENGRFGGGKSGGPVGIWAWDADQIVIQHNESYRNRAAGSKDGGGFDLDGGTSNSVLQYNDSHDNEGAGYLAFQFGYARPNVDNVIRFNRSRNDARKNGDGALYLSAGVRDLDVYGNRITVPPRKHGRLAAVAVTQIPDTPDYADYRRTLDSPVTSGVQIHDNHLVAERGAGLVRVTGDHPGLLFDDNEYVTTAGPFRVAWKRAVYDSVAAWRAATGQEPVPGHGAPGYLSWIALALVALAGSVGVGTLARRRKRRKADAAAEAATATASAPKRKRQKEGRALWTETLPKILPYAKPYWKLSAGSIATTIIGALLAVAQPWPIALVFDKVLQGQQGGSGFLGDLAEALVGGGRSWMLAFAIGCLFALTVIEGSVTLIGTYIETKLKLGMVFDFMSDLFDHLQKLGLTFHNRQGKGGLMNRVNGSPAGLGEFVASAAPIIKSALTLLGMLVVAAIVDWQVALASLLILPLLYYQISLYSNRVIPQLRQTGMLEMKVMSLTLEAMQMLRLIVSFGRERYAYDRFREEARIANEARMKVTLRQTFFSLAVNAATAIGTAAVLGLGALHVIDGRISTGELVVLMSYIAAIYNPLSTLTSTVSTLNQELVNLSFALEILEQQPEIVEAPDAKDIERVQGRMTFDDVSFTYQGRATTLDHISFDVDPGQRVAVVGQTGSGKSTLASLMIRFYDPQEGSVQIDGMDLRELTLRSLREQIAVVLQEPLLLSGTIGDNILYGRLEATQEEIVEAAKAANVHDFIAQLPKGYETELGEGGAELSGGEQQRICVARAFLKDAPILILDEPTSSIDAKTEHVIFDALEDLMVGRTSFVITHRLSTIRDSDLIMVMAGGRIVDKGTHDDLYETSELYRSLYGKRMEREEHPALVAIGNGASNGHAPENGHPAENGHSNGQPTAQPAATGLPPIRRERRRTSTRFAPAPVDLLRSSLIDELELQVPFRELLTHWDLSSPSAEERALIEEELRRAEVGFEPSLADIGEDDLVTLRLQSRSVSPIAAALDEGWRAVRARLRAATADRHPPR